MEFQNLEDLKKAFVGGNVTTLEKTITINGVVFTQRHSTSYSMIEMIEKQLKGIVIYAVNNQHKQEAKDAGLMEWVLLMWGFNNKYQLVPFDVRNSTQARVSATAITEGDDSESEKIIGDTVKVRFINLLGNQIRAKVDTGATISSLHATNISTKNGSVSFICEELSSNIITMPIAETQAISSADGGTEMRPVVEMSIQINKTTTLHKQLFNLNDRSNMDYPVLIGQNTLEAGSFIINPKLNEQYDVDWEELIKRHEGRGVTWYYENVPGEE